MIMSISCLFDVLYTSCYFDKMSVYYFKDLEKKMAIRATLQTKLACGALIMIITNVCILIAIIAYISCAEVYNLKNQKPVTHKTYNPLNLGDLKIRTTINDYPWMTTFIILPDEIFSGTATIISKKWAITTAQCIQNVAKYPITMKGFRGGSTFWNSRGFYHYAATIVSHNKFNPSTLDYNVALVEVIQPFVYTIEAPVSLSEINFDTVNISEVIGWATFNYKPKIIVADLLHIEVELLPKNICKETLEKRKNKTSMLTSLCTYKKAETERIDCDFSSGSALMVNDILIGIAASGVRCGESHLPGIYVNLTTVKGWIEHTIK